MVTTRAGGELQMWIYGSYTLVSGMLIFLIQKFPTRTAVVTMSGSLCGK